MSRDPALDFLLANARAQGMSLRKYQREYGVRLMPAELDTAAHEVQVRSLDGAGARSYDHCPACRRKRIVQLHAVE